MLVKKTKRGRFTFALSFELREKIFRAVIDFLEGESPRLRMISLTHEEGVKHHLFYSTLDEFIHGHDFWLITREEIKWTITRAEAIALMWLLRQYDDELPILELKSELHQKLQP